MNQPTLYKQYKECEQNLLDRAAQLQAELKKTSYPKAHHIQRRLDTIHDEIYEIRQVCNTLRNYYKEDDL